MKTSILKRLKIFLQEWEGIWLIPSLFFLFIGVSSFLIQLWGPDVGIFRPGLLNKVFLASFVFFVGTTVVNFVMNFYHRGFYRYYYKKEVNKTVKEDFQKLPPWLRVLFVPLYSLLLLLLFFYLVVKIV